MQLEGEPVGILAGGKFVLLKRGGREGPKQRRETGMDGGDPFLDRPGVSAHLQRRGGEEAAAGEDVALQVAQERLTHRCQLGQAGAGRERGLYDFCVEDPLRLVHGGQLEFLLGAEVCVKAALADSGRGGQVPDRQTLEPVNGGQRGGSAQDDATGSFAVGARASLRIRSWDGRQLIEPPRFVSCPRP